MQVTVGFRVTSLFASIDGRPVPLDPESRNFSACAGPVRESENALRLPLASKSPTTTYSDSLQGNYRPAVADGYYLMVTPLRKGSHTITFGGGGHPF